MSASETEVSTAPAVLSASSLPKPRYRFEARPRLSPAQVRSRMIAGAIALVGQLLAMALIVIEPTLGIVAAVVVAVASFAVFSMGEPVAEPIKPSVE